MWLLDRHAYSHRVATKRDDPRRPVTEARAAIQARVSAILVVDVQLRQRCVEEFSNDGDVLSGQEPRECIGRQEHRGTSEPTAPLPMRRNLSAALVARALLVRMTPAAVIRSSVT